MKNSNEITLRLLCTPAELGQVLLDKGFQIEKRFTMDDIFLIPQDTDTAKLSVREILARAVLLRSFQVEGQDKPYTCLTFKHKTIAPNGQIMAQSSYNCGVLNAEDARGLLEAMGYCFLMEIIEHDIVYEKNGFSLSVKDVENSEALVEIETEAKPGMETVEALLESVKALNLPLDTRDCFVKKAELVLTELLNKRS